MRHALLLHCLQISLHIFLCSSSFFFARAPLHKNSFRNRTVLFIHAGIENIKILPIIDIHSDANWCCGLDEAKEKYRFRKKRMKTLNNRFVTCDSIQTKLPMKNLRNEEKEGNIDFSFLLFIGDWREVQNSAKWCKTNRDNNNIVNNVMICHATDSIASPAIHLSQTAVCIFVIHDQSEWRMGEGEEEREREQ